jgi:Excalibur calcium-binding domain
MRRLLVVGAVLLAACSSPTEGQGQAQPSPTVATATTAASTTTEAATTTRPATTRPIKLVVGKYCAAMHAAGWSFEKARAYYEDHGQPAHMDADGDGIPCETVYGEVGGPGPAPAPQEDCDPAYPDDCLPSPPPDLDCADIGHRVTVDHSQGDPHRLDADGDGIGVRPLRLAVLRSWQLPCRQRAIHSGNDWFRVDTTDNATPAMTCADHRLPR